MRRHALALLAIAVVATIAASRGLSSETAARGIQLTPVERLPFPARGFLVGLPAGMKVEPGAVRVRENGRLVRRLDVAPVGAAGIHTGLVLAIDASESMTGAPLASAVAAARTLVAQLDGTQQVGVLTFNDRVRVLQAPTTSRTLVRRALAVPRVAYGTRMLDAVDRSVQLLATARLSAGSVVLLSDGSDVGSRARLDDVLTRARERGVRVFTVGLRSGAFDLLALRRLAEGSGATYAEARSENELRPIYAELGQQLAGEYVVRYRSDAAPASRVRVTVQIADFATARATYTAPTPSGLQPFHRSLLTRLVLSPVTVLALCLLVAALAAVAANALARPRGRSLAERVDEFAALDPGSRPSGLASVLVQRPRRAAGRYARLEQELEVARIAMPAGRVVFLTAAATFAVVAVLLVAAPAFAVLGVLAPLFTRSLIARRLREVRSEFAEQLAPNLQVLASALRVGHSFIGALAVVVENAHEPSRSELRRVIADERLGVPVDVAIGRVADRMASRDLIQVALLAELQRTAGGNSAEVLDTVVDTLRERADLRRLVKTLTAQGRMARWILTGLPVVVGLAMFAFRNDMMRPLYTSTGGQVALVVATLMVVGGSLIIQRIIDIRV